MYDNPGSLLLNSQKDSFSFVVCFLYRYPSEGKGMEWTWLIFLPGVNFTTSLVTVDLSQVDKRATDGESWGTCFTSASWVHGTIGQKLIPRCFHYHYSGQPAIFTRFTSAPGFGT